MFWIWYCHHQKWFSNCNVAEIWSYFSIFLPYLLRLSIILMICCLIAHVTTNDNHLRWWPHPSSIQLMVNTTNWHWSYAADADKLTQFWMSYFPTKFSKIKIWSKDLYYWILGSQFQKKIILHKNDEFWNIFWSLIIAKIMVMNLSKLI